MTDIEKHIEDIPDELVRLFVKVFAKTDGWENITIKDFLDVIEKMNTCTNKVLSDGTLVIDTDKYDDVKRVLVEHGTKGTLYYSDSCAN